MGIFLLYILILLTIVYFRLRIIVPRETSRIEMEKERDKKIQEEWQQYMDMYEREKEMSGNQELIAPNGEVGNEKTRIEKKPGVKVRR